MCRVRTTGTYATFMFFVTTLWMISTLRTTATLISGNFISFPYRVNAASVH